MEAKNYISNHGLEQLKEFEYLKSLHEEKVKNLSISAVIQQRELLKAYEMFVNKDAYNKLEYPINKIIEKFLAFNCG
jgi:type IV secretory pathway TrbF-like protein